MATLNKLGEKNSNVASWGCKALFALSVLESNKPKFANTDSCQALVKSLKEHYENEVVAEWACAAIASIAPLEGNRSKLGSCYCYNYHMKASFLLWIVGIYSILTF